MSKKHQFKEPNHYVYEAVRQTVTNDEIGTYDTYGIKVSSDLRQIALISDVSPDEEAARHLAKLCTSEQLDPIHLNDVIQDFLAEITTT